jgi:hypothetical protein
MATSPSSEFAGTVITGTGQTGEVISCFANITGAVTDQTLTRNDTNAALSGRDGYRIRVIGAQIFGGNTAHTITINSKPVGGVGVAITPGIGVASDSISNIEVGAIGICTTRENETLTVTTSGDVSIQVQVVFEAVYNVVQTIPVTNPTLPGNPVLNFDAMGEVYKDGLGTPADNGDTVLQWVAGAFSADQSTAGNRPTFRTAAFNGKSAVEFSTNDFMPITGGPSGAGLQFYINGTNTEFTLFLVVKHLNQSGNQTVLGLGASGANPKYQFGTNTNTLIAHKTDDAGTSDNFTSGSFDVTIRQVLTFVVDNASSGTLSFFRRVNGDVARATDTPTGTNATFNGGALTATNATLGALTSSGSQSNYANVQVAKILLYNSELSAEARSYVENQLIQTYL